MSDFSGSEDLYSFQRHNPQLISFDDLPQKYADAVRDLMKESPLCSAIDADRMQVIHPQSPSNDDLIKLEYIEEEESLVCITPWQKQEQKLCLLEQSCSTTKMGKDKYPKNMIKNFMVEFFNFMFCSATSSVLLSALPEAKSQILRSMMKVQKYITSRKKISNARELQNFLCVPGAKEIFIYFLTHEAQQWIERSNKLQLKQFHLMAIPYFIKAAATETRVRFPIKDWKHCLSL